MAKIIEHTPAWLSRPSPGFDVFQPSSSSGSSRASLSNGQGKKLEHRGVLRTIAHRGTEIFVASGNQIKWADLVALKEAGKEVGQVSEHCKVRASCISLRTRC